MVLSLLRDVSKEQKIIEESSLTQSNTASKWLLITFDKAKQIKQQVQAFHTAKTVNKV